MQNTAINTLGYSGIVTISRYIGNKKVPITKIHNAGGEPLFNFLAECLMGDFSNAKIHRPTKIMLLNRTEDAENKELLESASGFIYLLNTPEKSFEDKASTVTYSFAIAKDQLETATFNCIGLYSDSAKLATTDITNYAAICNISEGSSIKYLPASILVVDWKLIISNKSESKEV